MPMVLIAGMNRPRKAYDLRVPDAYCLGLRVQF
jgi:hypothetical protein